MSRLAIATFLLLAALLLAACAASGAGGRPVDVTQLDDGCTPTVIEAVPGEKLDLRVRNDTGKTYEIEGINGTNLEEVLVPEGRERSVGFNVPASGGTYHVKCYVPGGVSTIIEIRAGGEGTGGGDDDTTSDTNFVGEASVRWIFERSTLSALVNQQVVPSSGGEAVARTRADLGLGYRVTEKFESNLSGYYRRSDPLRGNQTGDQTVETFGGRVGLTYRFTENLGLSLDYSYTKTDQESDSVVDDETNRVFLQLRWVIHKPEWRVKPPTPLVKWPHRL